MRWTWRAACSAMMLATRFAFSQAADSTTVTDAETGFTFSQYVAKYNSSGLSIIYRIAVPGTAQQGTDFDAVVQITAPIGVGWAGLAWGGNMVKNPLTVAWPNGRTTVTVSSRMATTHAYPSVYSGATYEVLKTGTHVNYTHWQVTAKCTGCTQYTNSFSQKSRLNPKGTNRMAFAESSHPVANPSSSSSTFEIHDVFNAWNHDFATGNNAQFANLVTKNGGL